MQLLQTATLDESTACPYLPDQEKQYRYFLAGDVSAEEMDELLEAGWRKFGIYFFSPACPGCRQCIPLRVPVREFRPSRSQQRVWRKNADLRVEFKPLNFTSEIYDIYAAHAEKRFGQDSSLDDFLFSFYLPSCPTLQAEYYLGDTLIGVGFLDCGRHSLSSIYFAFDPQFSSRGLGTFSALQEIEFARRNNLRNYYLGYFVPGCSRMVYKNSFVPNQCFDWASESWREQPTALLAERLPVRRD